MYAGLGTVLHPQHHLQPRNSDICSYYTIPVTAYATEGQNFLSIDTMHYLHIQFEDTWEPERTPSEHGRHTKSLDFIR